MDEAILYDYHRDLMTLTATLFVAVCLTLVWNISTTIKETYTKAGLSEPITFWWLFCTIWGSLGLWGGIGNEIGRRLGRWEASLEPRRRDRGNDA